MIEIIGGGTLGRAMLQSILRRKLAGRRDITVSDVAAQSRYIKNATGTGNRDNAGAVKGRCGYLAVKPGSWCCDAPNKGELKWW
jgi:pyrroline-5-carboxylate reductase